MKYATQIAELSAALSLGDEALLRQRFKEAVDLEVPVTYLVELLLQTALFAGVPRCLNGFRIFGDILRYLPEDVCAGLRLQLKESESYEVPRATQAGGQTFSAVYGDKTPALMEALENWHPQLQKWVLKSAYGEILSRPFLPLAEREVAAVAALTVLNLPLQLWGHMRGALINGVSRSCLEEVLATLSDYSEHAEMAQDMLASFDDE